MSESEFELRLEQQLHELITPPMVAPSGLAERIRALQLLEPVRTASPWTRRRVGVAGALAGFGLVAILIGSQLGARHAQPTPTGGPPVQLPATVEMFGRLDAKVAWAANLGNLYVTRDGGGHWSGGTIPGRGPGEFDAERYATSKAIATDRAISPDLRGVIPGTALPERLYPVFVDADHGWLVSWEIADPAGWTTSDWLLTVHRTSDGGRTWTSSRLPGRYDGPGRLQFVDAQHGWLTVSHVGGIDAIVDCLYDDCTYRDYSASLGLAPGGGTQILATSDGGATWSVAGATTASADVRFISFAEAWAFEESPAVGRATIGHTIDGGATWRWSDLGVPADCRVSSARRPPLRDVKVLTLDLQCVTASPEAMPLNGYGSLYSASVLRFQSWDDGANWFIVETRPIGDELGNSLAVDTQLPEGQPIAAYTGTAAYFVNETHTTFNATFDGQTWRLYSADELPGRIVIAEWVSPDDVWVLVRPEPGSGFAGQGDPRRGFLYASRDGSATWDALLAAPSWPARASQAPAATPSPSEMPTFGPGDLSIEGMGLANEGFGWVVAGGQLYVSRTGGIAFTFANVPLPGKLSIEFLDAAHGWATSSAAWVRYTLDTPATPAPSPSTPAASPVPSGQANPGSFVVTIFRTGDGGLTWQGTELPPAPAAPVSPAASASADPRVNQAYVGDSRVYLHFTDANHGHVYLVGTLTTQGLVQGARTCWRYDTTDGGRSWSAPRSGPCLENPQFSTPQVGWASVVGGANRVVTVDGGATWNVVSGPIASAPPDASLIVEPADGGALTAVLAVPSGDANSPASIGVYSSRDHGRTWTQVRETAFQNARSVALARLGNGSWLAAMTADAGSDRSAVRTINAGRSWEPFDMPPVGGPIVTAGPSLVWAAADGMPRGLLVSRDGGRTWEAIIIGYTISAGS